MFTLHWINNQKLFLFLLLLLLGKDNVLKALWLCRPSCFCCWLLLLLLLLSRINATLWLCRPSWSFHQTGTGGGCQHYIGGGNSDKGVMLLINMMIIWWWSVTRTLMIVNVQHLKWWWWWWWWELCWWWLPGWGCSASQAERRPGCGLLGLRSGTLGWRKQNQTAKCEKDIFFLKLEEEKKPRWAPTKGWRRPPPSEESYKLPSSTLTETTKWCYL